MKGSPLDRLTSSPGRLLAASFALILGLNAAVLTQPPVWDAAGSIFPAALYLYEHGFDLFELFGQRGYSRAGPNVHSYSVVTHLTAFG